MEIILLLGIIASSTAVPLLVDIHSVPEVGASTQYKTEDNFGNYAFGYNEGHTSGGSFRKEVGDSWGNKVGSYGLHDADGRARIVNYIADSAGFRADVHTNEPGVDPSQDPAHVAVNKPALATIVAPSPVAIAHPAAIASVVAHKTVVGAPVISVAAHHHAVSLMHAPVFHAPLLPAFVAHAPHVLL